MRLDIGSLAICPLWLITDERVSSTALRFWLYLSAVELRRSRELSRAELASQIDCRVETIDRWVRTLKRVGALTVIPQRDVHGWLPSKYVLNLGTPRGDQASSADADSPLPPTDSAGETVPRVARSRTRQAGLLYVDRSKLDLKAVDLQPKDTPKKPPLPPRFAIWWMSYPKKLGKKEALARWLKLGIETDDSLWGLVYTGVKKYNAHHRAHRTDPRYLLHPTTWLTGARWDDELTDPAPALSRQSQALVDGSQRFLERHGGKGAGT